MDAAKPDHGNFYWRLWQQVRPMRGEPRILEMRRLIVVLPGRRERHVEQPLGQRDHQNHRDRDAVETLEQAIEAAEAAIDISQQALGDEPEAMRYFDEARGSALSDLVQVPLDKW